MAEYRIARFRSFRVERVSYFTVEAASEAEALELACEYEGPETAKEDEWTCENVEEDISAENP